MQAPITAVHVLDGGRDHLIAVNEDSSSAPHKILISVLLGMDEFAISDGSWSL